LLLELIPTGKLKLISNCGQEALQSRCQL
jgi:hypothetical protein